MVCRGNPTGSRTADISATSCLHFQDHPLRLKPLDITRRQWLFGLFVIAAVLRIALVLIRFGSSDASAILNYPDEEAYWRAARSIASGEGLIDEFGYRATYMPVYPGFLAFFTWLDSPLLWARIVQALLGALVAPATFLLADQFFRMSVRQTTLWRWSDGNPPAWWAGLAGLAAAGDPFLVFFSGLLLTETLFATAIVFAWWGLLNTVDPDQNRDLRRWSIATGLFLLLSVTLRPMAAVMVVIAVVAVILFRGAGRSGLLQAIIILAMVMIGLSPWAIRNRVVLGEWRWLTTRGGISLYDGFRPGADGSSDLAHTKTLQDVQNLGELEWERYFRDRAIAAIKERPLRALQLAGEKCLRTWSLRPNVERYRSGPVAWISVGWMLLLVLAFAMGVWQYRRAWRLCLLVIMPTLVTTLVHMIFVGSVRYRVPVMPMIMVLSAGGLVGLMPGQRTRRPDLPDDSGSLRE